MLSLGVAECRNVLAVQNGATRVDERRVARGSSGGGELGMLCGRVRGQERRAGEAQQHGEQSHICNRRTSVALTFGMGVGQLGLKGWEACPTKYSFLILGGGQLPACW